MMGSKIVEGQIVTAGVPSFDRYAAVGATPVFRFWSLCSVGCLLLLVLTSCACSVEPRAGSDRNPVALSQATKELERAGLSADLAGQIVSLNSRLLELLHEEDLNNYWATISLFSRLGQHRELHPLLVRFPEAASLAALALEADSNGAALILQSLPVDDDNREIVYAIYTFFAEPTDAVFIAKQLAQHGKIISELWVKSSIYILPFLVHFSGPKAEEIQRDYSRWVVEVYTDALKAPEETRMESLDMAATFLTYHGETIKKNMLDDATFREAFLQTYWPQFQQILEKKLASVSDCEQKQLVWCECVADPRVWLFLHEFAQKNSLNRGLDIFDRYGIVAVDLWMSREFREAGVQEILLDVLTRADETVLAILADPSLRSEPLFFHFLKRKVSHATLTAGLFQLAALVDNPATVHARLSYWAGLSDQALAEELGPVPSGPITWIPGYQVYYLLRKNSQGREVSGADVLFAVVDAASFIPIGGGAGKLISMTGKKVAGSVGKAVVHGGVRRAVTAVAENLGEQGMTRNLQPLVIRQLFSHCRLEITDLARLTFQTFKRLGFGRQVFRNLTGLDARIFMRRDRAVFLNIGALANPNSPFGRVLAETASNAGVDLAVSSPAGQAAIRKGAQLSREAWHQFLSASWLAVGLNQVVIKEGEHVQK